MEGERHKRKGALSETALLFTAIQCPTIMKTIALGI